LYDYSKLTTTQKKELLESEDVVRYLGSMEVEERPEHEETNEKEDFS
jgi:hypothetical protein